MWNEWIISVLRIVSKLTGVRRQRADDVYVQMEHKQIKNVTTKMCIKNVINAGLKN